MSVDFEPHLGAVRRSVAELERDGEPARAVTLTRLYDTSVEDLWDAVTNPERLPRWFLPVEGEFRLGGHYQLKGNAGGTITTCDAPSLLAVTWEFGGGMSWVEVRLTPEGDAARLTLVHTAPVTDHWERFGAGATGVGWELGLMGLALHLSDPGAQFDEESFAADPDGQALMLRSAEAWGEADIASGADPDWARAAARRTGAFYTGQPEPEG